MYFQGLEEKSKDELLEIAIEVEKEGVDTYQSLLGRTEKKSLEKFFSYMLGQEKNHLKSVKLVLIALHDKNKDEIEQIVEKLEEKDFNTPVYHEIENFERKNIIEMLNEAMEFEENGTKFYRALEREVEDEELKRFFSDLKEQEKMHKERIKKFGEEELNIVY